jgi:hypothetical protein
MERHDRAGGMTDENKREPPISYRPPAALREEFLRRVEGSGLPVNAYITHAVFAVPAPRGSRRPPAEKQMLAQIMAETAAIRDRLDIHAGNDDDDDDHHLDAAFDDLAVIRAALLKMMERAP